MTSRPRLVQIFWLAVAVCFLAVCVYMQGPLDDMSRRYGLISENNEVMANNAEYSFLQMLPGVVRAPFMTWLWIRHDQLKEEGKYYEAQQLAEMRCALQPRNPYAWDYCAWDLAWNISVTAQVPDERYRWVKSGIHLLRDKALKYNPRSLVIYRQIGWIFATKMGGDTDDMHMYYKRAWAGEMQRLLGAPPVAETPAVIRAFEPIAQAPLDKAVGLQGKETIQTKCLNWLIVPGADAAADKRWYDADVAAYVQRLREAGVEVGHPLLKAYNQFSRDDAAEIVRALPVAPQSPQEAKISQAINDPTFAAARVKLLAFVRAQILWNTYRMDPDWMLELMRKYGAIDWRLTSSHGLYWVTLGLHVAKDIDHADVDTLNTDRTVQNCLKDLCWNGRLTYTENLNAPEQPHISRWADWRFISSTMRDYDTWIQMVIQNQGQQFDENTFRAGHLNFLLYCIHMLYLMDRHAEAQDLLDYLRKEYKLKGPEWEGDVKRIVEDRINKDSTGANPPTPDLASQQITAALTTYYARQAAGDRKGSQWYLTYARDFWVRWQKEAVKRLKQDVPESALVDVFTYRFRAPVLATFLIHPEVYGYKFDLTTRSMLYTSQDKELKQTIYDYITPFLKEQCRRENIDFARAFREPPGMEEYRQRHRRQPTAPRQ